jgi:hypothetical protein
MRKERVNCKVLPTASFLYSIVPSLHSIMSSPRRRGSRRQWKQNNSSRAFQSFILVIFLTLINIFQLNASLDPRLRGDDTSGDLVSFPEEPQGFTIPLEAREESPSVLDRHLKGEWGFSNDSRGAQLVVVRPVGDR